MQAKRVLHPDQLLKDEFVGVKNAPMFIFLR